MGDITGLGRMIESAGKLADSELVVKAYDDLLADAMKQGGAALADTVKAFRLFTAPIQLLAVAQDRLAAFCRKVREAVPEERQQEAAPSVALPVLMELRFMEDENPLTELYVNLLARAIDKERFAEAHPAFSKIIGQMSPDEAIMMYHFRDRKRWLKPLPLKHGVQQGRFPILTLAQPANFHMYAKHLEALSLLVLPKNNVELKRSPSLDGSFKIASDEDPYLTLTEFGELFVKACIPEDSCLEDARPE